MAGRLGDLVGHKKVFLAGITLFTLSSMACRVAPNQSVLIAGRMSRVRASMPVPRPSTSVSDSRQ